MYADGSAQILKGCSCGAKLFFFIKKSAIAKKEAAQIKLSSKEKEQIEKDVLDVIGIPDPDKPIILDLESINVVEPGKYELDLVRLFKGDPLIFKVEEGKYIIDIAESFQLLRKNK
jgi:predicted  nucleic acid-binding Zn-ribbon protein